MRRLCFALVALAVLVAPAAALALVRDAGSRPTAVGVAQREFHITPYRRSVPVGLVKLNIRNYGEDVHNLVVRGPGGYLKAGPDVDSGTGAVWTIRLRRTGTYSLLCTRANHLSLGMKAKLTVVAPKR